VDPPRLLQNLLEQQPCEARIQFAVPTNFDGSQDVKPLAAIDSGEKELFLSNRNSLPREEFPSAEEWVALCAQAAVEQDPKKLLDLVSQINRLLDARRKRLAKATDGEALR